MSTVKRVLAVMALLALGIYIGTKVRAEPTPEPSFSTFNSVVAKAPEKLAAAGQVLVADGAGKTQWTGVKGSDLDSGAALAGKVLLADGNGKAAWGAMPVNAAAYPKVRVVDDTGKATFYKNAAALAFPAVDFDVGPVNGKSGMVGADNTTLTVQEAGVYQITTNFPTEAKTAFSIMVDGKSTVAGVTGSGNPYAYVNSATATVHCAQGTKIQVKVDIYNLGPVGLAPNRGAIELVVIKLP